MPDMAKSPITFISYVPDKTPPRAKQLQISKLRSHVARKTHKDRRLRRKAAVDADQERRTSVPQGRETGMPTSDAGDPHEALAPYKFRQPQHGAPKQAIDWCFGNLGDSCRPIGNIDLVAIKYYLDRSLELSMSPNLLAKYNSSTLPQIMSPLFKTMIQRALSEMPLLNGLVSTIMFLMAQEHSTNDTLITAGHKNAREAMRNLRSWLSVADMTQPAPILSCVIHLCLTAFMTSDPAAAQAHLSFLIASSQRLNPEDPYHSRLLWEIRACNIRYALETGKPVFNPIAHSSESSSELRASETATISDPKLSSTVPPFGELHELEFCHGNRKPIDDLSTNHPFYASTSHQLHPLGGFFMAIESNILSLSMFKIVLSYKAVMDYIYKLAADQKMPVLDMLSSMDRCYECLDLVWFEWYEIQQNKGTTTTLETENSQKSAKTVFDEAVLLAIQIQLAICSGKLLVPTLPILARRLLACLVTGNYLLPSATYAEPADQELFNQCLLWVLISGLVASPPNSQTYQWYWVHAQFIVKTLKIDSEAQIISVLGPFLSEDMSPSDKSLFVAQRLVREAGSCHTDQLARLPSESAPLRELFSTSSQRDNQSGQKPDINSCPRRSQRRAWVQSQLVMSRENSLEAQQDPEPGDAVQLLDIVKFYKVFRESRLRRQPDYEIPIIQKWAYSNLKTGRPK